MTVGKRALGFAVVQLVCVAALLLVTARWVSSADSDDCRRLGGSANVRDLGVIDARVRVAQPLNSLGFQFGGRWGTRSRDLSLDLIDEAVVLPVALRPLDGEPLAVRIPRLVDRQTNSQIPTDKVHVQATYDELGKAVTFKMCVDVRDAQGFGAGRYEGIATLTDARFVEAEIPVDVSLRSRDRLIPMAAALAGGVIGGMWGTISRLAAAYKPGARSTRDSSRQVLLQLAISAGLGVLAAVGVFWQRYVEIPYFRGLGSDTRAVFTAAFLTALTVYPFASAIEIVVRMVRGADPERSAATAGGAA